MVDICIHMSAWPKGLYMNEWTSKYVSSMCNYDFCLYFLDFSNCRWLFVIIVIVYLSFLFFKGLFGSCCLFVLLLFCCDCPTFSYKINETIKNESIKSMLLVSTRSAAAEGCDEGCQFCSIFCQNHLLFSWHHHDAKRQLFKSESGLSCMKVLHVLVHQWQWDPPWYF